jgi:DNA repair ATPase RecN
LSNLTSNTSDHYPILIAIPCSVRPKSITSEEVRIKNNRVKWDKIDKTEYQKSVTGKLVNNLDQLMNKDDLEKSINTFMEILKDSANEMMQKKTIRKNKPKLRVWNEEIANKLKESRHAYWKWKDAGKPSEGELFSTKKTKPKHF